MGFRKIEQLESEEDRLLRYGEEPWTINVLTVMLSRHPIVTAVQRLTSEHPKVALGSVAALTFTALGIGTAIGATLGYRLGKRITAV